MSKGPGAGKRDGGRPRGRGADRGRRPARIGKFASGRVTLDPAPDAVEDRSACRGSRAKTSSYRSRAVSRRPSWITRRASSCGRPAIRSRRATRCGMRSRPITTISGCTSRLGRSPSRVPRSVVGPRPLRLRLRAGRPRLPPGFSGRLPRDRPSNRPFYEAIDGLVECLETLGRHDDCAGFAPPRSAVGGPNLSMTATRLMSRFDGQVKLRVVGTAVFSTLGIFRTCRDSRIGIERPQNGTHKPKEWPGDHVRCDRADGKETERR